MTDSKPTSSVGPAEQAPQATPVPVFSITSSIPPSILADLITSMIESQEPWANMWPWFKNLTLVCRSWSAEARRLEFLRISLSAQRPKITQKLIVHANAVRQRGDARAVTRSFAVDAIGNYGQFPLLKELLAVLSTRSLRELQIRSVRDHDHCLTQLQGSEHQYKELREMLLHRLTPIVIHRALLSCNPQCLQRLNINSFGINEYYVHGEDAANAPAIKQLTFPALQWLHFRLTISDLKATAQQVLQEDVTPSVRFLSVFVRDELVPFLVDLLCQRTSNKTVMRLQFHVYTPRNTMDQAHQEILKLMAHAERYSWRIVLQFSSEVLMWADDSS